jgi:hypothetical protein
MDSQSKLNKNPTNQLLNYKDSISNKKLINHFVFCNKTKGANLLVHIRENGGELFDKSRRRGRRRREIKGGRVGSNGIRSGRRETNRRRRRTTDSF